RREVGADRVLQENPDGPDEALRVLQMDLIGFYPYSFCRSNRSISWMRVGHSPWWRSCFERTDLTLRAQLWMSEYHQQTVAQRAMETGVWRERAVVLVDLSALNFEYFQGVSSSSRSRKRGAGQTVAINYPGYVDRAYVLHAPGFANRAWSILKHFLSAALMEKAMMVGSKEELRQMLDDLGAENVPRSLGGQSDAPTAPLPGRLRMPPGGWDDVLRAWRPREICISKGSTHEEVLQVPAGGRCKWQWALTCASVSFQVSRAEAGGRELGGPRRWSRRCGSADSTTSKTRSAARLRRRRTGRARCGCCGATSPPCCGRRRCCCARRCSTRRRRATRRARRADHGATRSRAVRIG
ncbi:unnamed protein product, partial [Prorocentrum cordatum]